MAIPRYKGIESIAKITAWFLKHDHKVTNKLWEHTEARNELNNWLICLFQNHQQSEINEKMNVLFHEFTYLSLPQLEEWRQKNILNSEEMEAYHNLMTLVVFQNAQLRIAGWIYQQLFKMEFSPFGNPFLILGYFDGFIDYYRVLDLPSTCTSVDIKKAYRAKAKTLHPDTGGDAEAFKQLKEAYDVLSDEQQRNAYNEKYQFYQNRYDYDIKPSQMENDSTFTTQNERPRRFIRFRWKPFLFVVFFVMLLSKLSPLINDITEPATTETKEQNQSNHFFGTDADMGIDNQNTSDEIDTQEPSDESGNPIEVEDVPIKDPIGADEDVDENNNIPVEDSKTESPDYVKENDEPYSDFPNEVIEDKGAFTLGSTKEFVQSVMGPPYAANEYTGWSYEFSSIDFDDSGLVIGWNDISNNLKVSIGEKMDNTYFLIGSTKEEVVNAMGTPSKISKYGDWGYEFSSIEFNEEGLVVGWNDISDNLRVKMGTKIEGTYFGIGSTKEEVVNSMGTPSKISKYGDWGYEFSSIEFNEEGLVTGWNDISGILMVK